MKAIGIIPARFASTRFPGKPLVLVNGITMIERVYRQAEKSKLLTGTLVATDDEKIFNHVKSFGGNVCMTNANHQSGTDRIAEACLSLNQNFDVIVNIQGDEPFISPDEIDRLINCFTDSSVQIATMAKKIIRSDEFENPNVVKVVMQKNGNAIYFSRHAIPFTKGMSTMDAVKNYLLYKHVGIYAYRKQVLLEITKLKQTRLEIAESLEQLRWLENGFTIRVVETQQETIAIDTPDDLINAEKYFKTIK